MQKIENVTFGSDPEFGIIDVTTGNPVSAFGNFGGTKRDPKPIGDGDGLQEDGVMLELTIAPVTTEEEFVNSIFRGKTKFQNFASEINPNWKVTSISSAFYSDEDLQDPAVREFGCSPSFCIYTGRETRKPSAEEVGNMRSAGFHIHIGTPRYLTIEEVERLIFCMDICCGLPSVILDTDRHRKRLYGEPGDFRMICKKHLSRVEYRTLGGNLHGSRQHVSFLFNQTLKAIEMFNQSINDTELDSLLAQEFNNVNVAISNSEEEMAMKLMKTFGVELGNLQPINNESLATNTSINQHTEVEPMFIQ